MFVRLSVTFNVLNARYAFVLVSRFLTSIGSRNNTWGSSDWLLIWRHCAFQLLRLFPVLICRW